MPTAAGAGAAIHYEHLGEGEALLLVPGIPAISSDWLPIAWPLAERFTVIVYDNRGSGRSEAPSGPYATAMMAADAVAVLDAVGVEQAHVFGVSMGGMIAQEIALGFPTRVDRLVLGCTHASTASAIRPEREVGRAFATPVDSWAQRMRLLAPHAFAPGVNEETLAAFIAKKSADVQPEHGYRAQIDAVLAHDAASRLGEVRAPTLVVTGSRDAIIPAANSEQLAALIPQARLEVIEGAGHLFFVEQPRRTVSMLREFLAA